jgi:hypothetical protein
VLIIKTQPGLRHEIEQLIRQYIIYTNLIAEFSPM